MKVQLSGIPPAPRGGLQINVCFDIVANANGIFNVYAEDKTMAQKDKITITNDKGRLSKEEVETPSVRRRRRRLRMLLSRRFSVRMGISLPRLMSFADKMKELLSVCNPIIAKMCQGAGGGVG